MGSEEQTYTPEFKKEVVEKALEQDEKKLEPLSDKYDVPVSLILIWTEEYKKHGAEYWEETSKADSEERSGHAEEVEVEIGDQDVADSFDSGVMLDRLDIKKLSFWSILGIILVLIFVQSLYEMYQFNTQRMQERISAESTYYQVTRLNEEARNKLSSFGLVDAENGIYRIPIDSAINEIASDEE